MKVFFSFSIVKKIHSHLMGTKYTSRLIIKGFSHEKYRINPIETIRENVIKDVLTLQCESFS